MEPRYATLIRWSACMPRPYSIDLRKRVVSERDADRSYCEVAHMFRVCVSSIVRRTQQYKRTGLVCPGKRGRSRE